MTHKVVFHVKAETELQNLYDYLADRAGPTSAWDFVSGIRIFCLKLADFPQRGTERTEMLSGLRVIGYRRSVSIAFKVTDNTVIILGIFYGGQNFTAETLGERR